MAYRTQTLLVGEWDGDKDAIEQIIYGIKDLAMLGGLNIIVYPPIAKTVNLNELKYKAKIQIKDHTIAFR